MVIVKCQNCGKELNAPVNWNRNEKCNTCGGYFTEVQGYPSVSNQLNQIGQDIGNNISQVPHIYLGKGGFSTTNPDTQKTQKTKNLNTQNTNLDGLDKGYEKFEKIRQYGMWIIILLVIGYAGFRIFKIIFFGG